MRLVARASELAAVQRFLSTVSTGSRVLSLEGEAGIGKTTLWNEGLEQARARGFHVLISRAGRAETKHSYAGLSDVLSSTPQQALADLPEPQRHAIAVALLEEAPDAAIEPRTIGTALLGILTVLAGSAPTVLALDDVQWLDSPSARAFAFALRRSDTLPIGVLITKRTPDGSDPLALDRDFPGDRMERIAIGRLSVAALHEIIHQHLGMSLPRSTLTRIQETGGGNPFYALEIARALGREGPRRPGEPLRLPDSLHEVVSGRLADLSESTERALLVISATGRATDAVVEQAIGLEAERGIQEAIDRDLVTRTGNVLTFTHPLLEAAVYGKAEMARRRQLHRRLADVVRDPEERARHLALGATKPSAEFIEALDEGARAARGRGAPDSAAELREEAVRLTPPDRTNETWRRTIDAAGDHFAAGHIPRARELLERVVEEAPVGPLRAEARLRLGFIRYHLDDHVAAVESMEQALQEAGDDRRLRSEIEQQLGWALGVGGDLPAGARHASAALELAEELADTQSRNRARAMVAQIDFLLGRGAAVEEMRRCAELDEWTETQPVEWRPTFIYGLMLKITGDLDRARAVLESLHNGLADRGDETALPWLLFHLSELECWAGNWDRARAFGTAGVELSLQTGQRLMRTYPLSALAFVEALEGNLAQARVLAMEGIEVAQQGGIAAGIGYNAQALGFIELSAGDAAAVDAQLGPLTDMLEVAGLHEPGMNRYLVDEIEALVALGRLDRAEEILGRFQDRAKTLDRTWALATGGRCRAMLLAARGELEAALDAVTEALACHERVSEPFELGRTLLVAGPIHRRAKRKRAAKDEMERSREIFERLGAPRWAERAVAELGRVGLRPSAPTGLTPTEQRVAELAASGLTNREVADAAFLSPRSVEGVLARVYRKLGIRSRAELGRSMEERAKNTRPEAG
jgi:DNA-binding CsgD family transcriptional regulator